LCALQADFIAFPGRKEPVSLSLPHLPGNDLARQLIAQELTSTGVPTGIERQKRFGRSLSWLLETVRLRNAHELGVGARAEN
jgi:hypothetical protein